MIGSAILFNRLFVVVIASGLHCSGQTDSDRRRTVLHRFRRRWNRLLRQWKGFLFTACLTSCWGIIDVVSHHQVVVLPFIPLLDFCVQYRMWNLSTLALFHVVGHGISSLYMNSTFSFYSRISVCSIVYGTSLPLPFFMSDGMSLCELYLLKISFYSRTSVYTIIYKISLPSPFSMAHVKS
jgi:hypothetical protein